MREPENDGSSCEGKPLTRDCKPATPIFQTTVTELVKIGKYEISSFSFLSHNSNLTIHTHSKKVTESEFEQCL